MNNLDGLAALLVPIIAMMIPIVAIVTGCIAKVHREQLLHETVRQLSIQGKTLPPELLDQATQRRTMLEWTPKRQLRAALVNLGAGIGVSSCLWIMAPHDWLWSLGLIPLSIGVALLILWKIETSQSTR